MPSNSIEKLKHAQSSIKAERQPVSQVQEATILAKEITQFVHTALNKENRWIFQTGEQESIIAMLTEINKTSKELFDKCRSPDQFNREIDRFLKMKNQIKRKSDCIHFSLDQGFYNTEPLGFSPGKAVELSLSKIRKINQGLKDGKWVLLPIDSTADDSAKNEVEKLFSEAASLASTILKNTNFNSFDRHLKIEEIQILYKYFQIVRNILDLENKAMLAAISKKSIKKPKSPKDILERLSIFEKKIKSIELPTSTTIPDWGLELYKTSLTDMLLRMHLLRIPFEPIAFQKKYFNKLKKQKELEGIEKSITNFHDNATYEIKQLQLFIEIFSEIDKTFHEVTGILQNLSISFGKIYHNASSQTITNNFLKKVLGLIQGMLEKGGLVANSKTQKLENLQQNIKDGDLFDPPMIKGVLYALDLLEEGKNEMNQFCEQMKSFLKKLSNASEWNSKETYKFLKKAYEESASLTSAAMIFESVTKTSILLKNSLKEIESILLALGKLNGNSIAPENLFNKTLEMLGKDKEYSQDSLQKSADQAEELNWLLDEMLGQGIDEEQRFVNELKTELRPVLKRIETNKLKESSKDIEEKSEKIKIEQKQILKKKTPQRSKKSSKPNQSSAGGKKSLYDPFEPFEMVAIKEALKNLESAEGKMMFYVMNNTHTFFTLLNKMESSFKPGEGLENELIQDIEKSKTTHEFLNNFARLKFLPHGYYNNNNSPFDYNKEKRRFEIPGGVEKQLKLSPTSIGSPMEIYQRLVRVLLGFDEAKTLSTIMPPQVLSIMEEDFMLKTKDTRVVEEKLQST